MQLHADFMPNNILVCVAALHGVHLLGSACLVHASYMTHTHIHESRGKFAPSLELLCPEMHKILSGS